MRKHWFIALLFIICLFALTACGGNSQPAAEPTDQPAAESAEPSEEIAAEPDAVSEPAPESDEPPAQEEQSEPADSETDEAIIEGAAAFSMDDLALEIDGVMYKVGDDAEALLSYLGEDYEYFEAESCVFTGMDKAFTYPDIEVTTYPQGDRDIIDQFVLYSDAYTTVRGVCVGDLQDHVIAQYGEGFFMDGDYMIYSIAGTPEDISSPRCYFEIIDGTVNTLSLHIPTIE